MKILMISHQTETGEHSVGTGHRLAIKFRERGHNVKFMLKKKWPVIFWFPWYMITIVWNCIFYAPDVILTYHQIAWWPAFLKWHGFINIPVIHYWWDYYSENVGKKWNPAYSGWMEFYAAKYSDGVITNSKYLQSVCRSMGIRCLGFIPPGVDKKVFFKDMNLELNPYAGEKLIVLYIGEQSDYKRTDDLKKAAKGLDCNLIMLSNESQFKVNQYLNCADICVITADQDSTLKMWEYIYMNKCILAYKGRIGYVLTHGEDAWLADDLRVGLQHLLANPKLRDKLAKGTKKFNVKSWDEVADEHLRVIQEELKNVRTN